MSRRTPTGKELRQLDQAQQIVYSAWEARSEKRAAELAHQAISISPLCADAYGLLASQAKVGSFEQLALCRQALAAGETALGNQALEDYKGEFWNALETRPYMRARAGLSQALWDHDEHEDAIGHATVLLKLNPNDNQGIRYILAAWLAQLHRDVELGRLLRRYKDDGSAVWLWTDALLAFRAQGNDASACKKLSAAQQQNPHVQAYLLNDKLLPKALPDSYTLGGEDEAVLYVHDGKLAWANTPGALNWLRATQKN